MDQGVQQPLARRSWPLRYGDPDLLSQVGQLVAGGRLDVGGVQGGVYYAWLAGLGNGSSVRLLVAGRP